MTVWQRIARFATVGVAVGTLTACTNLVGWVAAGTNPPPRTTGWTEATNAYLAAYLIGGNWHSRTGAVHNTGDYKMRDVQSRHLIKPGTTSCFWTDVSCNGVTTRTLQGNVYATTGDTNGDGYISGAADFQPPGIGQNCGMNSAATASFAYPAAAMWQDRVSCAYSDPNYASAESMGSYNLFWGSTATSSTHGQAFRNLPIETLQGIVNSVEASDVRTENVGGAPMQVVRVQVTKVSVGGESYKPVNVFVELYNWRMTKWDMSQEPGLKLMAAWMANKIENLLDRNATSIRFAVELNNSVTLTRADLPADILVSEPSYGAVEHLRNFATTNVRD